MLGFALASEATAQGHDSPPPRDSYLLFPHDELFEPMIADPRWPRFSAAYQWRLGTDEFDRVAAVSFGETFALVRSPTRAWGEWEFGFQASAFSIFDMGTASSDLSNTDYFAGFTLSHQKQDLTTQLRVSHTSSHLGDEYLEANAGTLNSVSSESIDLLVSYEPRAWLRLYGGGGALIHSSPSFDPILTQWGLELTSLRAFVSGLVRPILGLDLQIEQQNDWKPDVSLEAGVRIARPDDDVRRLEIVAQAYHGRSPDGQFFEQTIDSIGLAIRLGF